MRGRNHCLTWNENAASFLANVSVCLPVTLKSHPGKERKSGMLDDDQEGSPSFNKSQ